MKIAFINIYQNRVFRGAETFVAELAKRLSKNHEVDVLTSIRPLFKKRYDVIIPTNGRMQAILVRIIAWIKKSKMIISGQSGPGFDDRVNLYAFPDAFVALTEFSKKWANKINPRVRIEKIPNGVDLSSFKGGTFKAEKTILSIGAFTKEKRHDLTIRAVSKLPDAKLIIAGGGGDQKQNIKTLGEKMLGERFEILSLPHEKMPEVYQKANVLAFPSVPWESFGIAIIEAMASGLPVVATNDPIRREIVGSAGILVDPTNVEEYSLSLDKALKTNWGDKPRIQAEKFSWERVARKYEKLFKTLIEK